LCCPRTGGWGKHNIFSLGGAFRKAKYEIRRRRKNRNRKARAGNPAAAGWIKPLRNWINTAHHAEKLALSNDFYEKKSLTGKIGTACPPLAETAVCFPEKLNLNLSDPTI